MPCPRPGGGRSATAPAPLPLPAAPLLLLLLAAPPPSSSPLGRGGGGGALAHREAGQAAAGANATGTSSAGIGRILDAAAEACQEAKNAELPLAIQAMQACVAELQKYQQATRTQRERSVEANKRYASSIVSVDGALRGLIKRVVGRHEEFENATKSISDLNLQIDGLKLDVPSSAKISSLIAGMDDIARRNFVRILGEDPVMLVTRTSPGQQRWSADHAGGGAQLEVAAGVGGADDRLDRSPASSWARSSWRSRRPVAFHGLASDNDGLQNGVGSQSSWDGVSSFWSTRRPSTSAGSSYVSEAWDGDDVLDVGRAMGTQQVDAGGDRAGRDLARPLEFRETKSSWNHSDSARPVSFNGLALTNKGARKVVGWRHARDDAGSRRLNQNPSTKAATRYTAHELHHDHTLVNERADDMRQAAEVEGRGGAGAVTSAASAREAALEARVASLEAALHKRTKSETGSEEASGYMTSDKLSVGF